MFNKQHDRHVANSHATDDRRRLPPRRPVVDRVTSVSADHHAVAVVPVNPSVGGIAGGTDVVDIENRPNIRRKRESTKAVYPRNDSDATKGRLPTLKNGKQVLPEIVCLSHHVATATKATASNRNWNAMVAVYCKNSDEDNRASQYWNDDDRGTHCSTSQDECRSSSKQQMRPTSESNQVENGCQRVPADEIEISMTTDSVPTMTKIQVVLPSIDHDRRSSQYGHRRSSIQRGVYTNEDSRVSEPGGMMPILLKYRIDLLRQQQQQQQTRHNVVGVGAKQLHGKQQLQQQASVALSTDLNDKSVHGDDDDEMRCQLPQLPDDRRRVEMAAVDVTEVRTAEWKLPLPTTTTSSTMSTTTMMTTMMTKDDPVSRKRRYPVTTKASGNSVMLSPIRHRLHSIHWHCASSIDQASTRGPAR